MKFIKIIAVLSLPAAVIYQRFVPDELKIDYSECIECNRCKQICPSDAIKR